MRAKPASVEDYLADVPSEAARDALNRLRAIIKAVAPDAEEVISYGILTYKYHGFLVSIAAFKNHCSFFPGHTTADFLEELKGFKTAKGTVQFKPDKPLPEALVKRIVEARMKENLKH